MSLDLRQFHGIFFEESFEAIDTMESILVAAAGRIVDTDAINALFRAAHSMKGGSATFGFQGLTDFTHRMETLLDQVRHGQRPLDTVLIAVLLKAVDAARTMLRALRAGEQPGLAGLADADLALRGLLEQADPAAAAAPIDDAPGRPAPAAAQVRPVPAAEPARLPTASPAAGWRIRFRPHRDLLTTGNDVVLMMRELARFGPLRVQAELDQLPTLTDLVVQDCYLSWTLELDADPAESDLREVFAWVADACALDLIPSAVAGAPAGEPVVGRPAGPDDPEQRSAADPAPDSAQHAADAEQQPAAVRNGSIRVSTGKIDALVDLVGELVITQSMLLRLAATAEGPTGESLRQGMAQLERNTRDLQEHALAIRMLPIRFLFNRFPRLVHDLAQTLGKPVQLRIEGAQTELDKRLTELLADPLTHLLRNAMDHGIEPPPVRAARGKPPIGTLRLAAAHRGGSVFIEIGDDGAGIDEQAVFARGRSLGLITGPESPDVEYLLRLLCHPGLSTADTVTDLSGRGVGLDVVERNIRSLGGRLELATAAGQGTRFTIRIPLTLAILDGQLIRVGAQVYILPLVSIVETVQLDPTRLRLLPGGLEVYRVREHHLPVVRLASLLGQCPDDAAAGRPLLVICEVDDGDVGLLVDELLGQQQIVIKGLEGNFRKVPGVSAATVLGDGRVGLILDSTELKRLAGARIGAAADAGARRSPDAST
jgi:two-component system, chemotaxis family, sensor kinase CheA